MDYGLTFRDGVEALSRGHWTAAGILKPHLTSGDRDVIVYQALRSHALDPLGCPKALAKAEGFRLWWADLQRCGAYLDGNIYLPRWHDPEALFPIVQHERSHGWICKRDEEEATEGDVWMLTFDFAWPRWCQDREPEGYPRWFLDAILRVRGLL